MQKSFSMSILSGVTVAERMQTSSYSFACNFLSFVRLIAIQFVIEREKRIRVGKKGRNTRRKDSGNLDSK